jgi:HK97 gp10 family phage protein
LIALGLAQNAIATQEITDMEAVDTGRMRGSNAYQVDVGNREVIVGNTASYAIFVTLGTRFMAARKFLQNSINNYKERYRQIVQQYTGMR